MPDPRRNDRAIERLGRYLERPRTVGQVTERFSISERTAYRWMQYLKDDGIDIMSRRDDGVIRFQAA